MARYYRQEPHWFRPLIDLCREVGGERGMNSSLPVGLTRTLWTGDKLQGRICSFIGVSVESLNGSITIQF
jgi:hypothetical protein